MEKGARRRELFGFFFRIACFALIFLLLFNYIRYVLTPKYDYGICSMTNFYRQEKNTVDVLTLGTSLAYAGVNTNVLWEEYGLASYNLCSAEQPFWISYYYLEEALKTQSPKLILLDAKPSMYSKDYAKVERTILSAYGILSPITRYRAIAAATEPQETWRALYGIGELHGRYKELTAQDFIFPPDNGGRGKDWKGYIEELKHERHERPSLVFSKIKRPMNAREEEYARRIFELAKANGIELLLIGFPNPDYASDHMFYNSLWNIAAEYGFDGVNYNDPELRFGLRYSSDFADWQHLNMKGSITFSRRLGEDLTRRCVLPDRRGEKAYASYDRCAQAWHQSYKGDEAEKGEET